MKQDVTQKQLQEYLNYDAVTGLFTWTKSNNFKIKIGAVAGCFDKISGNYRITIFGKQYQAHILAWFYVYGVCPERLVHKDSIKTNNWLSNLSIPT